MARGKQPDVIGMDSPPWVATPKGQDPPPNAAIRLAVQPRPGDVPFQLEVCFYGEASRLAAAPVRIHLRSPDCVTFQHLAGQQSRGKRPLELDEQEQTPTKRRRHDPRSVQVGNGGDDDPSCVQFEARNEDKNCQDNLVDGYVVDLGLVKAFPSESSPVVPSEPWDDADQGSRAGTAFESRAPQLRVMRVSSTLMIVIIMVAGLFLVFTLTTPLPPGQPGQPTGDQVSLQPVDWFQRAMWLEIGLTSTARVTVLGEAEREHPAWACLPGLRPSHGPLHNHSQPDFGYAWWSADSPFYPRYKPWDSTSDGIYVPEWYFLHDVEIIVDGILADLETIANHGPPSFRFQQENSTQFRWSTSGGTFMPPHDTLPTLSLDVGEILTPASTVRGFPPSTPGGDTPSPTARPETIRRIFNLEPGIAKLRKQLGVALINLRFGNRNDEAARFWPTVVNGRARLTLIKLEDLGDMFVELDHDWGSDQYRIDCLYPKPTFDLAGPHSTVTPKMPRNTGIPSGVPMEFVEAVRKAQDERDSQSALRQSSATATQGESHDRIGWPTTNAAAAPCSPCPHPSAKSHELPPLPRPDDWTAAQKTNKTAIELLKILDRTVSQSFEGDGDRWAPKVHDLFKYRDIRVQVCTMARELVDHVQQVVEVLGPEFDPAPAASHPDAQWAHDKTRQALSRLHDVAPFIAQVAVVRLCEMSRRAERGVEVMQETELRLRELRQEISKVTEDGWLARDGEKTTYLHFPSLADIQQDWAAAQAWLRDEAKDVDYVYKSRDQEFTGRRGESRRDKVVWSRWGLKDARRDPMGTEALCWENGVREPAAKADDARWNWARGSSKTPPDDENQCGNATARHG